MVAAVRRGLSFRAVARRFHKSDATVRHWVRRAGTHRLSRVDWCDGPRGNPVPRRTPFALEELILKHREWLRLDSALGECGAAAIHRLLIAADRTAPCVRTIARILARRGVARMPRVRRPAPAQGWYLPGLAAGESELDSFDFVEGLAFRGGSHFDALTAISLWGNVSGTWVLPAGASVPATRNSLHSHWQTWGLPRYAQFDNDSIFQGSHGHRAHLGRLVHFCLCLGVTPVFAPPREQGFQNKIESYNAYWQQKVWARRQYHGHADLARGNVAFLAAHHAKHAARHETAPARATFPPNIPHTISADRVIFLRRADAAGRVSVCGQNFNLPPNRAHRLSRCEWIISTQQLLVFALHRKHPTHQPALLRLPWKISITSWFSTPR